MKEATWPLRRVQKVSRHDARRSIILLLRVEQRFMVPWTVSKMKNEKRIHIPGTTSASQPIV